MQLVLSLECVEITTVWLSIGLILIILCFRGIGRPKERGREREMGDG